jgi:RHS repeat-associated protein
MKHAIEIVVVVIAGLFHSAVSNAQIYSKAETIEYKNDLSLWVLSQPQRTTVDGVETARIEYGWKAMPEKTYSFGKLKQSVTYNSTGTVASGQIGTIHVAADGLGQATTLTNWKRGLPQLVTHADATSMSASVDNNGWIAWTADENQSRTCYSYDPMGRLIRVIYMSETAVNVCDASKWANTTKSFVQSAVPNYGLPVGYWIQTESTGQKRTVRHFDALWRVVLEEKFDNANIAATRSMVVRRYDIDGRLEFQSYPVSTLSTINDASLKGTWSEYDALGRTTSVTQDSELGPLTTLTQYQAGFTTKVTNPRSQVTTTSYLTYDEPTRDWPILVSHPQGAYTHIARDVFGKPSQIRRSNSASPTGGTVAVNRLFTYNSAQELCRTVEPETGATLMGYDGAGNMTWSAAGLPATTVCDATGNTQSVSARKVIRTHDARNRVKTLSFPDGRGNQSWLYAPDGLPISITTYASAVDTYPVVNTYTYNRRRLLVSESLGQAVVGEEWSLGYVYDANGHLASQSYPDGQSIAYAPNALGQPTQVGTYATGVSYFPNGAAKQFTYGNGVVHNLIQNARQLPERSYDCAVVGSGCAAIDKRMDLSYTYDSVGNISGITDNRNGQQTRSMTYDGLDRLIQAISPMFGTASYSYNVLDNLASVKVTGGSQIRDHVYEYDSGNRLSNIKNSSGATVVGIGYDVQGNIANKNGVLHKFDFGNRLREVVGKEVGYTYDGQGRRVRAVSGYMNPRNRTFQYSNSGVLVYEGNSGSNSRTAHLYLDGRLIASRTTTMGIPGGQPSVSYFHADALGTPIAVTDVGKAITGVRQYEPYGLAINETAFNRIGFTGHVEDAATSLTYMQQRYYDPQMGQFLSRDSVRVDPKSSTNFSGYAYARNNPYYYTDPDGRYDCHQSLSKEQCDQVRRANALLKAAQENATGNAKTVITGVIEFLGEEGDGNGVVIKATTGSRAGSWLTLASGGVLRINFNSLNAWGKRSDFMVAATMGHEGWHGWWNKLSIAAQSWDPWGRSWSTLSERRAGITEGVFAQGLGLDHPQGFWTRKGGFNMKLIDEQAERSVESMCRESARSGITCGP